MLTALQKETESNILQHNYHLHRRHQEFLRRGVTEGQGVFKRPRRRQSRGINEHVSLKTFTAVGGMSAYSLKLGNKSLEDKNNSNKIVLRFFSKVKGDFPSLEIQSGGRSHMTTSFPSRSP